MSKQTYDPRPLQELLRALLQSAGESYRQASLAAGLPHNAVSKYLRGVRPGRDACIALAEHFGINPNEMLEAAGYQPLSFFEEKPGETSRMDREIGELIAKIQGIRNPRIRRKLIEAIHDLLDVVASAESIHIPSPPVESASERSTPAAEEVV